MSLQVNNVFNGLCSSQQAYSLFCPASPMIPLPSRVNQLVNNKWLASISAEEAVMHNLLDKWIQQDDDTLAEIVSKLNPMHDHAPLYFLFSDLILKPAQEGNLLQILTMLERYKSSKNYSSWGIEKMLATVFNNAMKGGNRDVIFAVLRKDYLMMIDSSSRDSLQGDLLVGAVLQHPKIALELAGEDLCFRAFEDAVEAAIKLNRLELLCAFLERPEGEELWPAAASTAAKYNRVEVLKELFRRGLSEKVAQDALYDACVTGHKEAAHWIASQITFYPNKKVVSSLLKTGFFPSQFSFSMTKGLESESVLSLLEAYVRHGKIDDLELMEAWPKDTSKSSSLFRAVLVDRSPISQELRQFLTDQFFSFSLEDQELALRVTIWKGQPDVWIDALISSSLLSKDVRERLSDLRKERSDHLHEMEEIKRGVGRLPQPGPWNEEAIRKAVLQKSSEILRWADGKDRKNPEFIYFSDKGDDHVIGQIKSMPDLVFKSFYSRDEATRKYQGILSTRSACEKKQLHHLRVPQAFLITSLTVEGKEIPVNLVVEELLPVASHSFFEMKEFLEELNQDPKTRKHANRYLSELTSLVCKIGLADLKPTNVPFLKDGSGLGILDSDMQGLGYDTQKTRVQTSLYAFPQEEHSLIDWIAPENFEALTTTLEQDPDCPKKNIQHAEYEIKRSASYSQEKERARFHLIEYGKVDRAPIRVTEKEWDQLDPKQRDLCVRIVDSINRQLSTTSYYASRRTVILQEYEKRNQAILNAYDRLIRMGKIQSIHDDHYGTRVQA